MLAWFIHALRGSDKMIFLLSSQTYTSSVVKLINSSRACDEAWACDSPIWENTYWERMDQAEFWILPCTQPWVAGELLTCLVTPVADINLSLWYHPVLKHCLSHSAWVPPGEPESHHWERGCHLGEEESTGGQSPSSAAVHSQVLRQGVRLILLSRSRQTSPPAVAGMAQLVLHHGQPAGCLSFLRPTPSCAGLSQLPQGGAPASGCTLNKSSACKSCSQLCHTPAWSHSSSSWHPTRAHPESTLPFLLLPSPPSPAECSSSVCLLHPTPAQGKEFPRLLVCHRRTCEPFLWLAAELGLTQRPVQVFLTLLLASAWLQILLMSVSVQWLYKRMGTSACLCLKSTFSSPHDHRVKLKHMI